MFNIIIKSKPAWPRSSYTHKDDAVVMWLGGTARIDGEGLLSLHTQSTRTNKKNGAILRCWSYIHYKVTRFLCSGISRVHRWWQNLLLGRPGHCIDIRNIDFIQLLLWREGAVQWCHMTIWNRCLLGDSFCVVSRDCHVTIRNSGKEFLMVFRSALELVEFDVCK